MDVQPDEITVHGTGQASKWYSSDGINDKGAGVALNFLVDDEREIKPLAHGLGIAHGVHMHKKAKHIGTRGDFLSMQDDL